jgi:hypothetical protein
MSDSAMRVVVARERLHAYLTGTMHDPGYEPEDLLLHDVWVLEDKDLAWLAKELTRREVAEELRPFVLGMLRSSEHVDHIEGAIAASRALVRIRQIEPEVKELGEFQGNRILIGKSPECQMRFSAVHGVSGVHAILEWRDKQLWVVDPGARNPVELDGRVIPLKEPPPVAGGSKLKLGEVVIEVMRSDAAAEKTPDHA